MSDAQDKALARKGQTAGLVIAATMLLWIAAQWIGPAMGLPGRFALLFDFAALAALFWAMIVIYQMWRSRRASHDPSGPAGQSDSGVKRRDKKR